MDIQVSAHAEEQILRRGLNRHQVIQVAAAPEQIIYEADAPPIAQSRTVEDNKTYLIRVAFRDEGGLRLVITAYKTSKVDKYWQEQS